jgi:hypothetical protein
VDVSLATERLRAPSIVLAYSLVMMIDLVSILSRGAAFAGDLGFSNETCGQTRDRLVSRVFKSLT